MKNGNHQFYENIIGFKDFANFSDQDKYKPLPDDWFVIITDVENSTKAIDDGKYKQVNGIGVASIVAIINTVKPMEIPYIFGGDGATVLIHESDIERIKPVLLATSKLSLDRFELKLRIGLVKMEKIRQQGYDILVGKYQPNPNYKQAMLLGDGINYAENLIKDDIPNNPYLILGNVDDDTQVDNTIFKGFECRWNEIPSPHDENMALIIQTISETNEETSSIYSIILENIKSIYGDDNQYHPLAKENLKLTGSSRLLSIEANVRTAFQSGWERLKYYFKLYFYRWFAAFIMKFGITLYSTDYGEYKKDLIANTDYRKFDHALRMVISGSAEQHLQLRTVLEKYKEEKKIVFGMHKSRSSLITCIVTSYNKDHVHFLDGANGGYANASKELKQQLQNQ